MTRIQLRRRSILAIALMMLGVLLVAFSIGSYVFHTSTPLNVSILGVVGAALLVIGSLLLITELVETWMSRGQTALVDGLQAG